MSSVTWECGIPPFARRQWRQLRRRPQARMAGDGGRGPVREDGWVHARGGEAGGGAELGSRRVGGGEGETVWEHRRVGVAWRFQGWGQLRGGAP